MVGFLPFERVTLGLGWINGQGTKNVRERNEILEATSPIIVLKALVKGYVHMLQWLEAGRPVEAYIPDKLGLM